MLWKFLSRLSPTFLVLLWIDSLLFTRVCQNLPSDPTWPQWQEITPEMMVARQGHHGERTKRRWSRHTKAIRTVIANYAAQNFAPQLANTNWSLIQRAPSAALRTTTGWHSIESEDHHFKPANGNSLSSRLFWKTELYVLLLRRNKIPIFFFFISSNLFCVNRWINKMWLFFVLKKLFDKAHHSCEFQK